MLFGFSDATIVSQFLRNTISVLFGCTLALLLEHLEPEASMRNSKRIAIPYFLCFHTVGMFWNGKTNASYYSKSAVTFHPRQMPSLECHTYYPHVLSNLHVFILQQ